MKEESYQVNNSMIIYLKEIVVDKFGNPRIIISRSAPQLIQELFKREVPEIANNTVEIKKVVREPGERRPAPSGWQESTRPTSGQASSLQRA
jgi:N utilization substance protein A